MSDIDFQRLAFWSKYFCVRPQAIAFYRELKKNQFLSADELEHLNWAKRRAMLKHAYEQSPFYRAKYASVGMHPNDIKLAEDFAQVPCLTREDLRNSGDQILIPNSMSRFLGSATTGGSTGIPVRVCYDKRMPLEALGWRMLAWWGIEPYTNGAFVWRLRRTTPWSQFLNNLLWWPTVKLKLDAASMTDQSVHGFLKAYNSLKPPLLQGYAGAIHHLATEVEKLHMDVHPPKAIWVTSSPIAKSQRQSIARAFGAPVYDQYGSCEIGWYSAECSQMDGLHVNHDAVHVEFVDQQFRPVPTGELGDIVATDLHNSVFPMIRYINGDRGRALSRKCNCGVTLPLMDRVQGRISDALRLPSGKFLSGEYLTTIFDACPDAVKQFQVRQAKDSSITILFVPDDAYANRSDALESVKASLEAKVQGEVAVSLAEVDKIVHDKGKLRFIVSEIAT